MHNQLFMPPSPADSGRLLLKRAWEVRADLSYQCDWSAGYPHGGFILARTLAGRGFVRLRDGASIDLAAGTLAHMRPSSILGYGCVEPLWCFWWLECAEETSCSLPMDAVTSVPPFPGEPHMLIESFRLLPEGGGAADGAAASLASLVRRWERHVAVARRSGGAERSDAMINILTIMRNTLSKPLPVSELARRARLSEGRFRQIFTLAVGMGPKAYYEHLRLAKAAEWLRESKMKLDEIAERLGYSSSFHLSRAFKSRHGSPPSAFRPSRHA